jgi:hypothetical protein
MQPVLAARPRWFFTAGQMLPRYPPARHFLGLLGLADIVNHENVADIAFHLGRDVRVVRVHVEAVHARAVSALELDELWIPAVGDVVDLEAAVLIGPLRFFFHRGDVGRLHAKLLGELVVIRLSSERIAKLCVYLRQLCRLAADRGAVALAVDDHDVADHARLVAV